MQALFGILPRAVTPVTSSVGARPDDAMARGCAALEVADGRLAVRWLARARRLVPEDPSVLFLLAAAAALDDPERGLALLGELFAMDPLHRDALVLRVALLDRQGRSREAARVLGQLLSRLAVPDTPAFRTLANRVCLAAAEAGWVGLSSDGSVLGDLDEALITIGGRPIACRGAGMRELCQRAHKLAASRHGVPLLGSPVDLRAIRKVPARCGFARRRPARDARAPSWREGRRDAAIALVTHASGGGVERQIARRARDIQSGGLRAIVLRPGSGTPPNIDLSDGTSTAGLHFAADAIDEVARLLHEEGCREIEYHHWIGHAGEVLTLPRLLGVPYVAVLHDYAPLCPRVTFCGGAMRFCGEPVDVRDCEDCITDHGPRVNFTGSVDSLRRGQFHFLSGAASVIAPSHDAARRLRQYMPLLNPVVQPWEHDGVLTETIAEASGLSGPIHVALVGALGQDKGFDILLACVRDAERRALDLRFTVVGHTIDDARLMKAGPVFVTGRFSEGEAPAILHEDEADIGFLPSVWPETWCFALSALWQAGLPVVAFDLGAQSERIRQTGAGSVLPLGLPAPRINDILIRRATARRQNFYRLGHVA